MLKDLLHRNCWANQSQIYVEPPLVWGTKLCSRHPGHMTTTPIYGKNPSKIFSGTGGPISSLCDCTARFVSDLVGNPVYLGRLISIYKLFKDRKIFLIFALNSDRGCMLEPHLCEKSCFNQKISVFKSRIEDKFKSG